MKTIPPWVAGGGQTPTVVEPGRPIPKEPGPTKRIPVTLTPGLPKPGAPQFSQGEVAGIQVEPATARAQGWDEV